MNRSLIGSGVHHVWGHTVRARVNRMILTQMKECFSLLGCALRQKMSISYIMMMKTSERESHLVDGRFHSVWCTVAN